MLSHSALWHGARTNKNQRTLIAVAADRVTMLCYGIVLFGMVHEQTKNQRTLRDRFTCATRVDMLSALCTVRTGTRETDISQPCDAQRERCWLRCFAYSALCEANGQTIATTTTTSRLTCCVVTLSGTHQNVADVGHLLWLCVFRSPSFVSPVLGSRLCHLRDSVASRDAVR